MKISQKSGVVRLQPMAVAAREVYCELGQQVEASSGVDQTADMAALSQAGAEVAAVRAPTSRAGGLEGLLPQIGIGIDNPTRDRPRCSKMLQTTVIPL